MKRSKSSDPFVIDENVLVVANGRNGSQGSETCQLACIEFLETVKKNGALVIDSQSLTFTKYAKHALWGGDLRTGDQFFIWAFNNLILHRVVTLTGHATRDFEEFPDRPDLEKFHKNDRIWIALANATGATVANSVDSDYKAFDAELASAGISVKELCKSELKNVRTRRKAQAGVDKT
ncbi:MAG: hypothetical protein WA359_10635 [Acidimicrobiales bacterium]